MCIFGEPGSEQKKTRSAREGKGEKGKEKERDGKKEKGGLKSGS